MISVTLYARSVWNKMPFDQNQWRQNFSSDYFDPQNFFLWREMVRKNWLVIESRKEAASTFDLFQSFKKRSILTGFTSVKNSLFLDQIMEERAGYPPLGFGYPISIPISGEEDIRQGGHWFRPRSFNYLHLYYTIV
jgi:hypothetical protein